MNRARVGDGIPVELFQILKNDAVKVHLNMPANLENLAEAARLEKVSFQSQRKAMPNNAQTTTQLHSSHMLVK